MTAPVVRSGTPIPERGYKFEVPDAAFAKKLKEDVILPFKALKQALEATPARVEEAKGLVGRITTALEELSVIAERTPPPYQMDMPRVLASQQAILALAQKDIQRLSS